MALSVVVVAGAGGFVLRGWTRGRAATESSFDDEATFRTLSETVAAAVFVFQGRRMSYVNPAAMAVTGYSKDELLQMDFWAVIHPEFQPLVRERGMARQRGEVVPERYEVKIVTKDGQARWVDFTASTIDYCGSVAVLGTAFDITERKAAEAAVRESEEKLRSTVASMDDLVFVLDERGVFCDYHQPPTSPDLHVPPEAFLGKSFREVLPPAAAEQIEAAIVRVKTTGRVQRFEYELEVSGSLTPFEAKVSMRKGAAGQFVGVTAVCRNLTEQMQAIEALERSEEKYRGIFDESVAAIYMFDIDKRFVDSNEAGLALLGYSREELLGLRIPDVDADREAVTPAHTKLLSGGRLVHYEHQLRRRDGRIITVLNNSRPLTDDHGTVVGIQSTLLDITQRKEWEAALQKSEQQYRAIVEDQTEYICRWLPDGKHTFVNEAYCRHFDKSREALLACTVMDLIPVEHHDRVRSHLAALTPDHPAGTHEHLVNAPDGEVCWHQWTDRAIFNTEGDVVEYQSVGRDITRRKTAEDRLQRQALVFENMYDAVLLVDEQGLIADVNPAGERMFGYTNDELIGQSPEMLNRPDEACALTERIRAGLQSNGRWTGEIIFVRKDGTEGACAGAVVSLRDEDGRLIGNVTVNRDITDRKAADADKARLEAQLLHSQKLQAVGTLASGIAHGFENLLTAIFAYTEIAKETLPEGHEALRLLEKVDETARQARGLTNALLTFSHRTPIQKTPIDLAHSVEESLRLLCRLLPASIDVTQDISDKGDMWIEADESRVQQIILNLALNARDAMPDGGSLRVSLSGCVPPTGQESGGGDSADRVTLVVEDTGGGMTPEVRARAFEPFFTTKPRGRGTGLGLSLVLGMVEDLKGKIDVESRLGEGTRVCIVLPCCKPPEAATTPAVHSHRRPVAGGSVLVVQHNDHVRALLTSALRAGGHAVIAVASVPEALDAMRGSGKSADLAICDLDHVSESALARLVAATEAGENLRLILLAATVSINLKNERFRGARLLRKPFPMDELTSLADSLLADCNGDSRA